MNVGEARRKDPLREQYTRTDQCPARWCVDCPPPGDLLSGDSESSRTAAGPTGEIGSARGSVIMTTSPPPSDREDDELRDHLTDIGDGCGRAEMWEHLSKHREASENPSEDSEQSNASDTGHD